MSKRLRNRENSSGGSQGWMTTYSDLMSLLLTFFVLLYSMSTIDAAKFDDISYSLQAVLAGIGQPTIIEGQGDQKIPIDKNTQTSEIIDGATIKEEILVMYSKVKEYVETEGLDANVSVSMNSQGVFVDIKESILFESGSAEIKEDGLQVLRQLKGLIDNFDNDIVIEGHTDDVPVNTPLYPSNWELSTARAVSVVRYLSEKENVDPRRLSAIGYGEYRPIVPNDSSKNRAINRRVNMFIVFDEGSGAANGKGAN